MVKSMLHSSISNTRDSPDRQRWKGVRKRAWGRWVCEIRLPRSRQRIWLGSYATPEEAACAYDAASLCLRGTSASLNFPPSGSSSPAIHAAAVVAKAAQAAMSNPNEPLTKEAIRSAAASAAAQCRGLGFHLDGRQLSCPMRSRQEDDHQHHCDGQYVDDERQRASATCSSGYTQNSIVFSPLSQTGNGEAQSIGAADSALRQPRPLQPLPIFVHELEAADDVSLHEAVNLTMSYDSPLGTHETGVDHSTFASFAHDLVNVHGSFS
ncbi:hypothetical protein KP509_10G058000 [Ceratopteris richardii]|uniref:AP2/ERF domain-containing protein n=1 Tax=Ceratopteris richardii TaxID=49495 RepID=A0A8T2U2C4_CERRI|nr:hypothetical protein KP509_10G058000 [Ceratopteris richardii]